MDRAGYANDFDIALIDAITAARCAAIRQQGFATPPLNDRRFVRELVEQYAQTVRTAGYDIVARSADSQAVALPDPPTAAMIEALSLTPSKTEFIVHAYRDAGLPIPREAYAAHAYVLAQALRLAIQHPDCWLLHLDRLAHDLRWRASHHHGDA